jgi:hypothetical protein
MRRVAGAGAEGARRLRLAARAFFAMAGAAAVIVPADAVRGLAWDTAIAALAGCVCLFTGCFLGLMIGQLAAVEAMRREAARRAEMRARRW